MTPSPGSPDRGPAPRGRLGLTPPPKVEYRRLVPAQRHPLILTWSAPSSLTWRAPGAEDAAPSDVADEVSRDNHTRLLRSQWSDMLSAFSRDQVLSCTLVSRLWNGVTFVMRIRAARAAAWNIPEVSIACRGQADGLPAYRAAIASALAVA